MSAGAFDVAQRNTASHSRAIGMLLDIANKQPFDAFCEDFFSCVDRVMLVFKRDQCVERCIEFIAKFVGTRPENSDFNHDGLLKQFIEYLLAAIGAKDKAVRFRACQLISRCLHALDEEAEIDDDLWQQMSQALLARCADKIPAVRVQAINALSRLQDPTDADCPVLAEYIARMTCDASSDVRRSALTQIALNKTTIVSVLQRCRDTKEDVRKTMYGVLAEKINVRAISIADRIAILRAGLNDRSDSVRKACIAMSRAWLTSAGTVPELLSFLDVENDTKVCASLCVALIESGVAPDGKPGDLTDMASEEVLFWRVCCVHLQKQNGDSDEKVLPSAAQLCAILKDYMDYEGETEEMEERVQLQYIVRELLQIANVLDYADEAGRRTMTAFVRDSLLSPRLPSDLLSPLMQLLAILVPDEVDRVRLVAEIVDDVREPAAPAVATAQQRRQMDLKIAAAKIAVMEARQAKDECSSRQDFVNAEQWRVRQENAEQQLHDLQENLQSAVVAENGDGPTPVSSLPVTLVNACLTIVEALLSTSQLTLRTGPLSNLVTTLIFPSVQNENATIRNLAIRCLGLCALLDRDFAKSHLILFLQVAQADEELLQKTAIEVLFDLVSVFGVGTFEMSDVADSNNSDEGSGGLGKHPLIAVLLRYLDSEVEELRTSAVTGFTRLFLLHHVASPDLLARLVICYFNPATVEDANLQQLLSVFFPAFAFASRAHQDLLDQSLLPCMRTLGAAPSSSPLVDIKYQDVLDFFVYHTGKPLAGMSSASDLGVHESVALRLVNEILTSPESDIAQAYCKALTQMQLDMFEASALTAFAELVAQAKPLVDSTAARHLSKVAIRLGAPAASPNSADAAPSGRRGRKATTAATATAATATAASKTGRGKSKKSMKEDEEEDEGEESDNESDDVDDEEEEEEELEEKQDEQQIDESVMQIVDVRSRRGKKEYLVQTGSSEPVWKIAKQVDAALIASYEAATTPVEQEIDELLDSENDHEHENENENEENGGDGIDGDDVIDEDDGLVGRKKPATKKKAAPKKATSRGKAATTATTTKTTTTRKAGPALKKKAAAVTAVGGAATTTTATTTRSTRSHARDRDPLAEVL